MAYEAMPASPVYVANDGNGMMGGGCWWIWVILLFAMFGWGGNGFGRNNIADDTLLGQEFIKRDIFNTNQNVSSTACQSQRDILENRYTTQLGLQSIQAQNQSCCCETQKEIIENRYTNQLGLQNLGQQLASCCCDINRNIDATRAENFKNTCDITTAIHAEGEATRALINSNTMQELRDKLADRDRELMTANFQLSQQAQSANIISTLQPTPKPAYLTCSPYFAYGQNCGCGYGFGCGNV